MATMAKLKIRRSRNYEKAVETPRGKRRGDEERAEEPGVF